jgi:ubiquinone/menaquinone biosynthesis C-methylase UbiE
MNSRHSKVTDWGLGHALIEKQYVILDVGCGGGRTLSKLAERATQGKAYGVDYSEESVAASKRMNARWIEMGRAEVLHGSVSQLPFVEGMFDLVTAVETHFWWPNLPTDMREIFRVLKAHHRCGSIQRGKYGDGKALREIRFTNRHDPVGCRRSPRTFCQSRLLGD